jgi:hypothetical protein
MKSRALLIGVQAGQLEGVGNDVETMSLLLDRRGFLVRRCEDKAATRAGIIEEYERLIAETEAGDRATVFYSGHGGLEPPVEDGPDPNPDLQYIVPFDCDESTPLDFRGITAVELRVLLARLTLKTGNCTVILDCCHAAHMSRDRKMRPKALLNPAYLNIAAHIERMRAAGLRTDLPDPVSNRSAVRLVACAPWQFAYEYVNRDGVPTGLLTESLAIALEEAGDTPVTWAMVVNRIRARVRYLGTQRPDAEGESRRLLFDTATADPAGDLPVTPAGPGRVLLPGARLTGAGVNDTFAILPAGTTEVTDTAVFAIATVDRVSGGGVEATLAFRNGHSRVPLNAEARLLSTSAPRWPVLVAGTGPVADGLRTEVSARPTLRAVSREDRDEAAPLAEVEVGTELALRDDAGPLTEPKSADPSGIRRVVANAALLAKAAALRDFTPGPAFALHEAFTMEWGKVRAGKPEPLPESGGMVFAGDKAYVRLRNDSSRDLFFFEFSLAVDGAVILIDDANPSGLRLEPGEEEVLGELDGGDLEGIPIGWPDGVPKGQPRPESLLFLVTASAEDLSSLAQAGARDPAVAAKVTPVIERLRDTGSPLQRALAQASIGGSRGFGPVPRGSAGAYATRQFDYLLSPLPAPRVEAARFLVDERPLTSVRIFAPDASGPPLTVAVGLAELIIHATPFPPDTGIRVDGLAITADDDGMPVYRFRTLRFSGVPENVPLELGDAVVYEGPVRDYLDLAWWISADQAGGADLGNLLVDRFTPEEFRENAARLAAMVPAQSCAAAPVAAIDATASIVDAAQAALTTTSGTTTGLMRTTLVPAGGFGTGRHPATGAVRIGDFSFAYRVDPVT